MSYSFPLDFEEYSHPSTTNSIDALLPARYGTSEETAELCITSVSQYGLKAVKLLSPPRLFSGFIAPYHTPAATEKPVLRPYNTVFFWLKYGQVEDCNTNIVFTIRLLR